ncbi:hypothetical protein V5799_019795 [Amblyomma americanum]|uniref:Uncharacterized protein n=1 Tax=Amblyomma americanum TaxID=6943 RepID=A0AAQ4EVX0_AMBAM
MSTDQGGALLSSSSQNAFQPPPLSQPDTTLSSEAEREAADSDKPALPPTSSVARKASSCLSPAEASPPALSAGADADPSSPSMQQKLRRPSSRVSIVDERQVTSPGADELIRASTSCPAAALQGVSKESAPLQGKDSNRRSSRISASSDSEKALSTQASKTSRKASVVLPASSPGDASEGGSSLPSQDKAKRRSSHHSGSSQSEKPVSTERSGGSRKASYASPTSFDGEAASQSQEGAKISPSRLGEPSDTEEAVSSNLPGSPCNASDDETSSRSDRSGKRRPSRQRRRSEPQQGGSSRKPSCASPTQSSDVAVDGDAQGRQRRRSVQKRQSDSSGVKLSESTPDASSPALSPVPSASASTQSSSSDKAENLGSPAPKADSGGSKIQEGPSDSSGPKD